MSLVEEMSQPGNWWIIELAPDNRRIVAEIFEHPNGIVFADIGWDDPQYSGHPFHIIEGELKKDGSCYRVGKVRIVEIGEDDPLAWNWLEWVNYIGTTEGRFATRKACLAAITSTWPEVNIR
jgi:hypothetical protein